MLYSITSSARARTIGGSGISRPSALAAGLRNLRPCGSAACLPADFSSLAEVRRLADTVRQKCDLKSNFGFGRFEIKSNAAPSAAAGGRLIPSRIRIFL
jgi:hypothetical protein